MQALRVFGILFTFLAAATLTAQGTATAEPHRYAITLTAESSAGAPDLGALARELAATYGGVLESPPRSGEALIVRMLPERERLAASDPRVQSITEVATPRKLVSNDCSTCWTYSYDGAGNITSAGADTYRYDTVSRLLTATAGGSANAVSYAFDAFGNRTAALPAAGAAKCVGNTDCDISPQVNRATNHFLDTGTSYDSAGNLLGISGNAFTFDGLSMGQSAQLGATTLRYVYTADDERLATYDGSLWTWTVRDLGAHPLREFTSGDSGSGGNISYGTANLTQQRDYIWRGALMLASEARRSYSDSTQVSERFHLDHLGTPRLVTDDNGSKLGTHTYYPFGGELDSLAYEQPEAELKFTGHARDTGRMGGLSLDDMHARYYSADLGRFLSIDPGRSAEARRPQSWNRYPYANNSPSRFTDPDGKIAIADDVLIGAAIGAFMLAAYLQAPSVTVPERTNGQVALQSAAQSIAATWALAGALAETLTQGKRELRFIIGESMSRVYQAAPQAAALPLPDIRKGPQAVPDSILATQTAINAGARMFDVGFDKNRTDLSAAYISETMTLKANGYHRYFSKMVMVGGRLAVLFEWQKTPPTQ